ncbi:MAG: copper chaperone PCu(A)C [Paraglaciecola sp.]|uniref:copper chaperone PCu(A)C n=1 Tax=Paraglaciecola sp. TaxID=1920173 RepID=UPI0032654E82
MVNAHDFKTGKLEIGHPWARPTSAVVKTGAIYFSIKNPTPDIDKLMSVEVSSNIAQQAEIHQTKFTHDMAQMREAKQGLVITAKNTTTLSPGGIHIMLVGLTRPLELGSKFPMTLHFQNSGAITVEVWVEDSPKADTDAPTQHHH